MPRIPKAAMKHFQEVVSVIMYCTEQLKENSSS